MRKMTKLCIVVSTLISIILGHGEADGSGKWKQPSQELLSKWFLSHGATSLVVRPHPKYFKSVTADPYYHSTISFKNVSKTLKGVCGMKWTKLTDKKTGNKVYKLKDFENGLLEAASSGYHVTHYGQCGACSSLQDLGVYLGQNLTNPTRRCAAIGIFSKNRAIKCLHSLGFSDKCASIWFWNTRNTRRECFWTCMKSWAKGEPNNQPDGSLNDCLECDEIKSGPVFQFYSGRTRRNSGIPSAISRPAEQLFNVTHDYWYGDLMET